MEFDRLDTRSEVIQTTSEHTSLGNESGKTMDSEDNCVICLDGVSEQATALPCQHKTFDFVCLLSWLERRTTCPLCKSDVHRVLYNSMDGEEQKIYHVPRLMPPTTVHLNSRPRGGTGRQRSYRDRRHHMPPFYATADEALLRRRNVYRNNLYSLHVGSNRVSRFRDLTPQLFSRDAELTSRARKWVRRELQVFEFLSEDTSQTPDAARTRRASNAEFLLEYIIAILKTVDTQGSSGQAEEMLQEFLGRDTTRLFLHELRAWLRSPYTSLEDWDRAVQYAEARKEGHATALPSEGRSGAESRIRGTQSRGLGRSSRISRYQRYVPD